MIPQTRPPDTPNIENVFEAPKQASVPKMPEQQRQIAEALFRVATPDNVGAIVDYAERLSFPAGTLLIAELLNWGGRVDAELLAATVQATNVGTTPQPRLYTDKDPARSLRKYFQQLDKLQSHIHQDDQLSPDLRAALFDADTFATLGTVIEAWRQTKDYSQREDSSDISSPNGREGRIKSR